MAAPRSALSCVAGRPSSGSDWLRPAQRIPVAIEFDPAELPRLRVARIGGQAEVLVYTGDNPIMNTLGAFYIRVMSWLSYVY